MTTRTQTQTMPQRAGSETDRTAERFYPGPAGARWGQDLAEGRAMRRRAPRLVALASATALLALAASGAVTTAEPPSGVAPTLLARGTYGAATVRAEQPGPVDFAAEATTPLDIVVRQHDYEPHSTTGWHRHPGPVFITVTQGTLTHYAPDDPTCTPHTLLVGQGLVDDGRGHVLRNETDHPAQDVSVIIAPVGGPFRTDLPAPNRYCGF
jgi:hypothetical protein